ncbi:polygalacturonase [Paraburkholderia unamae]|uniref:glycoside hydrolase family 28 protein n=1 Tax=Paraburkholderia unamae TaxID=219649 RepID=UPI000DC3380C|nr:glycoside hydrolase family 28 protein [Paraburkholderia unamae]RAR52098.1 polygalacturonase [Paraburkholderia unamae]
MAKQITQGNSKAEGGPASPGRRTFMAFAGASAGATMLAALPGCGGGSGSSGASASTGTGGAVANDPIWGTSGAATRIISSLSSLTQSMFRAADFNAASFGAKALTTQVQASVNPYTQPFSPGADQMVNGSLTGTAYDSCSAFNLAIETANLAGGGRVVVPAGNWYCGGPIVLLSNVNFHLSAGCTIYFSPNPADYAKSGPVDCGANGKLYYTRWQGNDCLNFGSPVYAYKQTNIAITGEGETSILNGQAMTPFSGSGSASTCWWTYKGSNGQYGCVNSSTPSQAYANPNNAALTSTNATLLALITGSTKAPWNQDQNYLPALSQLGVPVAQRIFGVGHYLRPCMVEFVGCTNVLMESYHTQNTPFWQNHPTDCANVVIRGVFADSIGPNNDGFDPEACTNVLCDSVTFNTGDDCIAIKSGKALDTEFGPAQDHVIQNCTMNSGHGGITLGSEMSAGVQRIYARQLNMLNQNWQTNPLNIAIRIKTNMSRGGFVKDVYIDSVDLPNGVNLTGSGYGTSNMLTGSPINASVPLGVTSAAGSNPSASQGGLITFDCDYSPAGDAVRISPPVVQNVNISNVNASNVTLNGNTASCFQAIVAQGPVASDYNGASPAPTVSPITGVTISNCNLGTPVCTGTASATTPGPIYVNNVNAIALSNVVIAGTTYNTSLTG